MAKFYYEHPDLVREGIIWTGKRPDVVAMAAPEVAEEIEMPNPYGKLCEICGKPLQSKMQKKYCGPECRNLADARWAAQRRHEKSMTTVRTCQLCGKEYHPAESKRLKYCSDECARLATNRYIRMRKAIKRGKTPGDGTSLHKNLLPGLLPGTSEQMRPGLLPPAEGGSQRMDERCKA